MLYIKREKGGGGGGGMAGDSTILKFHEIFLFLKVSYSGSVSHKYWV